MLPAGESGVSGKRSTEATGTDRPLSRDVPSLQQFAYSSESEIQDGVRMSTQSGNRRR